MPISKGQDYRLRVVLDETCIKHRDDLRTIKNLCMTQALFLETRWLSNLNKFDAPYTWAIRDKSDTCISLPRVFLECSTEYEAALMLVGCIEHWNKLLECPWFIKKITPFRDERVLRDNGEIYKMLIEKIVNEGDVPAAKMLKKEYLDLPKPEKVVEVKAGVGRPSEKEEKQKKERTQSNKAEKSIVSGMTARLKLVE